jgi:hypothetical protein
VKPAPRKGVKLAIGLLLGNGFPVPAPFFLSYLAAVSIG